MQNYLKFVVQRGKMFYFMCIVFCAAMAIVCGNEKAIDMLTPLAAVGKGMYNTPEGVIYSLPVQGINVSVQATKYFPKPMTHFAMSAVFKMQSDNGTIFAISTDKDILFGLQVQTYGDNRTGISLVYTGDHGLTECYTFNSTSSRSKWFSLIFFVKEHTLTVYDDCVFATEDRLSVTVNLAFAQESILTLGHDRKSQNYDFKLYITDLTVYDMSVFDISKIVTDCTEAFWVEWYNNVLSDPDKAVTNTTQSQIINDAHSSSGEIQTDEKDEIEAYLGANNTTLYGIDLLLNMNASELRKLEAINGQIYCLQNQSFTISKPASDYFIKPMSSFMVLAVFRMHFTWSTLLEVFSPNQGTVLKITIYANRDNTTHILLTYIGASSSTERHKLKVDSISSFTKWTSVIVAVLNDSVSVYIDCKYVTEGRLSASVNLSFDENTMLSIGAEGKGYISTLKIYDMSLHTVRDVLERCYDAFKAFSNGELENATCSHGHVTELLRTTTSAHHTYRSTATTKSLLSCPKNQDFTDTEWPSAYAGELKQFNCTDKYNGTVTRKCNAFGVYENPVYNCTKIELQRLLDTVENDGITSESVAATIESLKTEITVDANKNLHVGDIEVATEIMKMIVIADINSTAVANVTDSFLDVVDNLISNKTTNSWDALKDQGGAARVLYVLDDFIAKVANSNLTEVKNMTFVKNNLYIKIDTANDCKTVSFPGDENRGNGPDWAKQSKDNIEVECRDGGSLQYSGSLFRNLSAIMTGRTEDKRTTKQINGPVLSFKKLATNQMKDLKTESVKIVFQIFNSSLDYPICSYWKKDEHGSNGQWLGDGCWLEDLNRSSGLVTCVCSHLTNFAVLMSPSITVSKIHHQALSAITVVGCTLSMTGLVATAIAYLYFWRLVKSDRATLLIHLCVTLFVAYLVFLIGIQRTEHTVTCTSISVVLHYVYLVAFFIMLAEGGVIALMVLRPLGKKDVVSFFLGASYGIPLIIVGISIGVTQFRGYGNERFCWLTVETGLFWAFAGPVLAIVATNMVITVLVLKQLFGVSAMAKRKDVEKIKTGVRSVCILLPVLGLTWVFGIFAVNRDTIVFQYLFAIFNSLQGFLIFIVQCVFDRKVRDAFRQARIRIPLFTTTTDVRTVETEMKSTQKSSSHKGSASTSSE